MSGTYNLVFQGETAPGADLAQVKKNLAQLLKVDGARLEGLFSGRPVILKRDLDHPSALRYQEALQRTGARCRLEPAGAGIPPQSSSSPPVASASNLAWQQGGAATAVSPQLKSETMVCPKCGVAQPKGDICSGCGIVFEKYRRQQERQLESEFAPLPPMAPQRSQHAQMANETTWGMLCHLAVFSGAIIPFGNILGPLVIWLMKRHESEFVDSQGKIVLNFQLTFFLFIIGAGLLGAFLGGLVLMILMPIIGILAIYAFIITIVGAIKASNGDFVEIRISHEFIKYD
ncbi:MAG TPA: DUF4870 domain-containing protein [Geobacterales bacterium]|nr:DUF4870 domain-containing protein [Geobacterales bacterium]